MRRPDCVHYDEPFGWWGPVWEPPTPRTVRDLIGDGTLTAETAALLGALLARRASIAVAAGAGGAGKTTLLTALLDLLPADTRRVYVRGCHESFAFLADPTAEPERTYLLVNEISAHLPIYLWGPAVRRVLGAARDGYRLAATAHATSVEGFVQSLAGYPLRVPAAEIAAIHALVLLDAWHDGTLIRREVATIAALSLTPDGSGLCVERLVERADRGTPPEFDLVGTAAVVERLTGRPPSDIAQEIGERAAALRSLPPTP